MSVDTELAERLSRIKEVLSDRIEDLACSTTETTDEEIASIANHYTAMRAVEWFQLEHKN